MKEDFVVELNIPSDMDLVTLVVELGTALMELRQYSTDDREAIRFAIHETLVNAIRHGNREKSDARVGVKFYFKGPCFYTDIEDEGAGFDPENLPDPTDPENILKQNGRGIFLVQQLTENFKVERLPNRGMRVSFCRLKHNNE